MNKFYGTREPVQRVFWMICVVLRVSLDFSNVPAEYFGTPARQSPRFDEFSGSKKEDSSDDFFC